MPISAQPKLKPQSPTEAATAKVSGPQHSPAAPHSAKELRKSQSSSREMMVESKRDGQQHEEEEEEYVLLDLDGITDHIHIPPNAPYVLSGLDTVNPIMIIDKKIKLIGEYVETIGTCLVFNESDEGPTVHEEVGPSEANLFSGRSIIDPKQTSAKQVNPVASLHKVLKFKLLLEAENEDKPSS